MLRPSRLLLLFILLFRLGHAQFASFRHITTDQGLSYNSIATITQDKKGFLWFGTFSGLCRYDGYKMSKYEASDGDSTKLFNGTIRSLFADDDNNMWVGTNGGGLSKIDLLTNKITNYMFDSAATNGVLSPVINDINEFEKGFIYLATENGVSILDKKTGKFKTLLHSDKDQNSLLVNYIRAFTKDINGHIWFAHSGYGITEYIPTKNKFIRYATSNPKAKFRGPKVRNVYGDSKGLVWISMWNGGIMFYNTKRDEFLSAEDTTSVYNSLKSIGLVSQFIEDRNSDIWMCTAEKGIIRWERKTGKTTYFENNPGDPQTISDNTNLCIFQDRSGLIWSGTWKGGANYFDPTCLKFGHFKFESNKENSLVDNHVFSFFEERKDRVLVGTGKSLCYFDPENKNFTKIPVDNNSATWFHENSQVTVIYKDYDGKMWYCSNGGGLYKEDLKTGKRTNYPAINVPNALSFPIPNCIYRDGDSNLWIGTFGGGLNLYNRKADNFDHFLADDPKSPLYSPVVLNLTPDEKGNVWVGTERNGLLLLDPKKRTFKKPFTEKDPLLHNGMILSVLPDSKDKGKFWIGANTYLLEFDTRTLKYINHSEQDSLFRSDFLGSVQDAKGDLWLTSSNDLFRFHPSTKKVDIYTPADGTQGIEFNYHSILKLSNNKILVGGTNGMNYFDPNDITDHPEVPALAFTDILVLNKPNYFKEDISRMEEITLRYSDYFFSIYFAALDFTDPKLNAFKYKMDGLDEDWIYVENQHQLTFTNLDPGEYVLNIKGRNSKNVWNEEPLRLKITITPPFWRTKWFYALCLIVIVGGVYLYIRWREQKLRKEKELLEKKVEERTYELNEEKLKVEEAHKDIKDSINYAQKIQASIIPSEEDFKRHLPDSFVLFQPKDVVSGDFYWIQEKSEYVFCAIADCTGHGVPGGFMTMLGSGLLNETVNEQKLTEPSDILDKLREKIISTLKQTGKAGENKDGMDIVLLRFHKKTRELAYACANNGFLIIEDGVMTEYYGDKQPVGIYGHEIKPFTAHKMILKENVTLYSYTDGYPDQFGGEKGKKFKYKTLNELLVQNSHLLLSFQKDKLLERFVNWKGVHEQIDDVCVMGIKF
jgi:ligand-binding sensor domain-containing protein/serine phosphatase RsbU (regulator of sigma subunit)